jgi:hypothetical protein
MTVFDLLFAALFLTGVVTLLAAAVAALRGRRDRVAILLRRLVAGAAAYLAVVVAVSLASPRRVLDVGEDLCSDDWCLSVTGMRREARADAVAYDVTFRLSSRAGRRAQRELGVQVYLLDDRGRRYDPVPDDRDTPFDVLLQPLEAVTARRAFAVPADASGLLLAVSHGGAFPGCLIIGESDSLLHARTAFRLE